MTKKPSQTVSVKLKKITAGLLLGALAGLGLECVGTFWALWEPTLRFLFDLPLGAVTGAGGLIGAFIGVAIIVTKPSRLTIEKLDFQHLPLCAADFLRLVVKKMRYRKKVRAEVMAELAAHFEDELRDCKTNEEKEQKSQQLIEQFGDVKLLGVLLRRAKKRCRPLWRTVVARTFQAVGVLILCFILYTIWFWTGEPNIRIDYLAIINQMNRPQLAEENNAWPHYEKAIELFVETSEELKKMNVFKNYKEIRSFAELTKEEREEIKKWVQQNESAWREFVAGSLKAYCYRQAEYNSKDKEKWLWNILLPHLNTLRYLEKVGIWRSRMAIEQGRIKQGLEDCLAVIRTGRFWQEHKLFIVEQLVGIALSRLGHNEILLILESEDIAADDLHWLQGQLPQIYADGYPLMDIEGEKLAFMDIVQHTFTDSGPGGGHLIPERMAWMQRNLLDGKDFSVGDTLLFTGPAMYHVGRDKTVRKANEIYGRIAETAKMTPYQRHINEVKSAEDIILSTRKWRYLLISIFMPALGRASELAYRGRALHDATVTVIALKRWRLEKGSYPKDLETLVESGILNKLPMDPWSDEPLVYQKTFDDFILYSVGKNFIDDGGEIFIDKRGKPKRYSTKEGGDMVFWPMQKN